MPSRGRVKVYLIDEVHMLSKPAFNALLKTLEEPPGHVKFLLATTDPQKLPVTVLSRCLQFNLKRLDEQQISGQITRILEAEGIPVEPGAVRQLAKAADGSLRDGLSLLDQAIAYTGAGEGAMLADAAVAGMLGSVDRSRVNALLGALGAGNGEALLGQVAELAEFSPDWNGVLDAIADALHRVQVKQLVPAVEGESDAIDVDALAAQLRPELVQLWYQMALNARRDLNLAPSPRAGFEMAVLRMLAFRPGAAGAQPVASGAPRVASAAAAREALAEPKSRAAQPSITRPQAAPTPTMPAPAMSPTPPAPSVAPRSAQAVSPAAEPTSHTSVAASASIDNERWLELVAASGLSGPARQLANHAGFAGHEGGTLRLTLAPADEHLQMPSLVKALAEALAPALGGVPQIRFETAQAPTETLHQRSVRDRDARQVAAEAAFLSDAGIQHLIDKHGATLVPDSIRPFDE
jgi:DNA polymerase-3 subunit gamma/tau